LGGGDDGGDGVDGGAREEKSSNKRKRKKKKRRGGFGGTLAHASHAREAHHTGKVPHRKDCHPYHRLMHPTSVDEGFERVLMDDHVDDSLLTVIPFTDPGLRVWDTDYHAWVGPEEDLGITRLSVDDGFHVPRDAYVPFDDAVPRSHSSSSSGDARCAVVMVGETLEFLTGGRLPATRHKVVHRFHVDRGRGAGGDLLHHSGRPARVSSLTSLGTPAPASRLSFPFLLRARDEAMLHPGVYGGGIGGGEDVGEQGPRPSTTINGACVPVPVRPRPVLAGTFIDALKRRRSSAVYAAPSCQP
jgi:hypothetical protein